MIVNDYFFEDKQTVLIFYFAEEQNKPQIYLLYGQKWSMVKRSILIGSLSGPHFAIRTAKINHSLTDDIDLCF